VNESLATFDACVRIARSAVIGDLDALVAALDEVDPGELPAAIGRYQLRPLIQHLLDIHEAEASMGEAVRQALVDPRAPGSRPTNAQLLEAFGEVRDALAHAGIGVLLLKGAALARLYGGIDVRPQYDLDVLVRRRHARRARRLLRSSGFRRSARDSHSLTLVRGDISVDLHHALRTSPAYRIDEEAVWGRAKAIDIAGFEVRALADTDCLMLLAMSLVEDIGFAMAKLKNLCDIWLLARVLDAGTDWEGWLSARRTENLEPVVVTGCAIALAVMSTLGDPPRLGEALARRSHLIGVEDRRGAVDLLTSTRGSPANMAWFAEVYPGSLLRYRAHAFVGGLPDTLRYVRPSRLRYQVELRRFRASPSTRPRGGDAQPDS